MSLGPYIKKVPVSKIALHPEGHILIVSVDYEVLNFLIDFEKSFLTSKS